MGAFDRKAQTKENQDVVECDRQLAALAARRQEVCMHIGQLYVENNTVETAKGTPYEADVVELEKIEKERDFYEKRKLAVQGMRKCEKCGNVLVLDSIFCNKCGEKLAPLFQPTSEEQRVCSRCGAPYEEGMGFCVQCGNKLS